ncbi:MAG: type II toxin-antitoxin system RelE/ParE family toxin [Planctomycetia bacterium]|nr:type II toxin-antitoxin system RelE/ParE family toxin [Planctomycetia bacterium]
MSLPIVFHPDVRDEVDEAYKYYEERQSGLGDDFLAAVREVYRRIQSQPRIHQVVWQTVRRGLTKRFPYGIFYRVLDDRVEVIAVYHLKQDPTGWQSRV